MNTQPCTSCGQFANRGVSVDAVIIKGSQVLLIQRGVEPNKGYWGTPGGYVEWDESLEEAVAREVKEETGLHITAAKFVGINSEPSRHPKQVINAVYRVQVVDGEPVASDDAQAVQWFSLDALPEKMALDHKQNIQAALQQQDLASQ